MVSGVQVAILHQKRILVQFRPLPPGWELPGGHCEPGEDPAECALREVREETGLVVRLDGVVGIYRWAGLRSSGDLLYRASVIGGRQRRSLEAWTSRWAEPGRLPRTLFPWFHTRIADALVAGDDVPVVERVQRVRSIHVALFGLTWMRLPVDALVRRRRG